jgi:hypothetical protein
MRVADRVRGTGGGAAGFQTVNALLPCWLRIGSGGGYDWNDQDRRCVRGYRAVAILRGNCSRTAGQ